MNKIECRICHAPKKADEFNVNRGNASGRDYQCKSCKSELSKNRYLRDKEKINKKNSEWYRNNKKSRSESMRKWATKNKSKIAGYSAKWRLLHPGKVQDGRIVQNAKSRCQFVGEFTIQEWNSLVVDCGNMCVRCHTHVDSLRLAYGKRGKLLEVDHIIPLSRGGTNYIWNIQPLCQVCNARKHAAASDFRTELVKAKYKKPTGFNPIGK